MGLHSGLGLGGCFVDWGLVVGWVVGWVPDLVVWLLMAVGL